MSRSQQATNSNHHAKPKNAQRLNKSPLTPALGLLILLGLGACGQPFRDILPTPPDGGSDKDAATTAPNAPDRPSLEVAPVKQFRLTWSEVDTATHYRVLEDPDGKSGYLEIAKDIKDTAFTHVVPLWLRGNASYVVQACNNAGCSANSDPVKIQSTQALTSAIGYFKASNAEAEDAFGWDAALSDDGTILVVGALQEDSGGNENDNSQENAGAVYVFEKTATGWTQVAYLKPHTPGAPLGASIAVSSDASTIAIGSSDGAYVFVRSGSAWIEQARVEASKGDVGDLFSFDITLSADGNTLAVGAIHEASAADGVGGNQLDNSAPSAGAAYVFVRTGSVWNQQAYLKAKDSRAGDEFGSSIVLSADGNTLAVGASEDDTDCAGVNCSGALSQENSGAVHLFSRTGSVWTYHSFLKASNPGPWARFGTSLGLSDNGTTLAVGARGAESGGAAYVFAKSGSSWSQQAHLTASNVGEDDKLGKSVAITSDGNTILAGASGEDSCSPGINPDGNDDGCENAGAGYVFSRVGTHWQQVAFLKIPQPKTHDVLSGLGVNADISGDGQTIVLADPWEDTGALGIGGDPNARVTWHSGAVYLF